MTKKQSDAPNPPLKVGDFFGRFHALIFTIGVGGGLTVAVYMFMTIITGASTPVENIQTPTLTFDTKTLEHADSLRPLNVKPQVPDFPSGRTDPFPQ